MNDIQNAANALVAIIASAGIALPAGESDAVMYAAAYACGQMEGDNNCTLALDYETEWLQKAYELGRRSHPRFA